MRSLLSATVLALASTVASAQVPTFRFFGDIGYAQGGDSLVNAYWVNGSGQYAGAINLNAGDGYVISLGADMRLADRWTVQANVGYETKRVAGANANLIFDRYPVELLGFYEPTPNIRLGAGVRKSLGAIVTATDAAQGIAGSGSWDSTPGPVLEFQYLFNEAPRQSRGAVTGLRARYVQESYSQTDSTGVLQTRSGNHAELGLFFYY